MALLQQQMQQALAQGMMQQQMQGKPGPQQLAPVQSPSGMGNAGMIQNMLSAMAGGGQGGAGSQSFQPPQSPTLGFQQPMPMQLPDADPQGQQKQAPLPPDPTSMGY